MTTLEHANTRQELYEYLTRQTRQMDLVHFDAFVTSAISEALNISRNLTSQYLNERFRAGDLVKINSRPVYFFDRRVLKAKYKLQKLREEYDDLAEFVADIRRYKQQGDHFEQAIGYNLTLKDAVEKCKSAVDYPPHGLPFCIVGQPGTGKALLAGLSYQYARDHQVVSEASRFVRIDCRRYDAGKWTEEDMICDLRAQYQSLTEDDFLYLQHFDALREKERLRILELIDRRAESDGLIRARVVLSTGDRGDGLEYYLQRIIPIRIELPSLKNRSIVEKERMIYHFLAEEEIRVGKPIYITSQAYHAMLRHTYVKNVEQLRKCIQSSTARVFSGQKNRDALRITLGDLPDELIDEVKLHFDPQRERKDGLLSVGELRQYSDFYREEKLCTEILNSMQQSIALDDGYTRFLHETYALINEYNDYVLFKRSVPDERMESVEHAVLKIFEHLMEAYGITISVHYTLVFARWVYYSQAFQEIMGSWEQEHQAEIQRLLEYLRTKSANELTIAKDALELIRQNLDIRVSKMEMILLTLILNEIEGRVDELPIQASIICHGYATASSMADVANKMLKRHVFNAIDMPYDTPVSEVSRQLRKILQYSEKRDVILLVDLGSLENIVDGIGEIPDINVGIMNHATTGLALAVGTGIIDRTPLDQILAEAAEQITVSYRLLERRQKEDMILFVSDIASDIAEKVSELFTASLPVPIDVEIRCYDYDTFLMMQQAGNLGYQNILFVATTANLRIPEYKTVWIEDIITFRNLHDIKRNLAGYLTAEEFEDFRKNLLNVFSLQNVVEALTILNAGKTLQLVSEMLDNLQIQMHHKFREKTIVGLNVHICCLIERLVKKEEILTHLELEAFLDEGKEFADMVRKSFTKIARQYNIELPMSEIAYIYDYISHEDEQDIEEGDF